MFCTVNADNWNMFPFLVIWGLFFLPSFRSAGRSWLFNSFRTQFVTFVLRDSAPDASLRTSYFSLLLLLKSNEVWGCWLDVDRPCWKADSQKMLLRAYYVPPFSQPFCLTPRRWEMQFAPFCNSIGICFTFNVRISWVNKLPATIYCPICSCLSGTFLVFVSSCHFISKFITKFILLPYN